MLGLLKKPALALRHYAKHAPRLDCSCCVGAIEVGELEVRWSDIDVEVVVRVTSEGLRNTAQGSYLRLEGIVGTGASSARQNQVVLLVFLCQRMVLEE